MLACPYGVIEPARDGKVMVKCDLCLRRAEAGLEPACVAACPTGALRVEELDEALEARRRDEQALVAARHARHAAPQDPAQKSATCEVCGRAFAPAKQLQLVRKKAGDAAVVPNVCPPCRRAAAAEALARSAAPAPEGEANPRETTGE